MPDPSDSLQVYTDLRGHFRWRLRAANGRIIAVSGEGYDSLNHTTEMAERVTGLVPESVSVGFVAALRRRKRL